MNKEIDDLSGSGNQRQLRQEELAEILQQTEALTPKQLKAKNKERDKIKVDLRGGGTTSVKEWNDLIVSNRYPSLPHFGYDKPYYKNIYKIKGWPENEHNQFVKRHEVAIWTIRLIYGRFPSGVIQYLRKQNPFLFAYIRKNRYYHYLNEDGQKMLDGFIDDFNRMIVGYDEWDKFEVDYCNKHNIKYQGKLDI